MFAPTGFHPNHDGRQLGNEGQERTPRQVLPQDNCAGVIHAHDVENLLGNVDPQYPKMLFHRTRLLWSNDFIWR
jgi:hypothetical protein